MPDIEIKNVEQYLNGFFKGKKEASLVSMKCFMKEYNNFQSEMRFIHIAGTNGKGSCVEVISKILICEGYKVGKFISPHLIKFNERISINEQEITDEELAKYIQELQPMIEQFNKNHDEKVSFFELMTMIGLLYFYRNNVDFVVLETGLGGLFDSTNIISKPLVSLISSIGFDHMSILGDTLPKIAYEKAGIIKENSNTVFLKQDEEVNKVFIDTCIQKNNNLHLISIDEIKNYRFDEKYQYFDYKNYKDIKIVLKGKKQVQNTTLCIETMKILNELGYKVSEESIRKGLKEVIHKGRMEILNKNPLIIFDGAHNEPAIINFKSMIEMYYSSYKRVYVISILKRKDYNKMIELLLKDQEAEFIFTSGNSEERYTSSSILYNIALKNRKNQKVFKKNLNDAIEYIKSKSQDTVSFIVGSFYIYEDVTKMINNL